MLFVQSNGVTFWGPATVVSLLALLWAITRAPWRQLFQAGTRLHLFLGAAVGFGLLWQLRVDAHALLYMHPMLIVALVLVFGPSLALCAAVAAHVFAVLISGDEWLTLGPNSLFNVVVPVLFTHLILQLLERIPRRNLFFYTLGVGFFGAMLSVQAMALSLWLYTWLLGPEPLLYTVREYYFLTWLMMFPEGFVNGSIVTVLTVLRPDLVKTYDDQFYLDDQ